MSRVSDVKERQGSYEVGEGLVAQKEGEGAHLREEVPHEVRGEHLGRELLKDGLKHLLQGLPFKPIHKTIQERGGELRRLLVSAGVGLEEGQDLLRTRVSVSEGDEKEVGGQGWGGSYLSEEGNMVGCSMTRPA